MSDAARAFERTQADLQATRRQLDRLRSHVLDITKENRRLRREAEVQDGAFAASIDEYMKLEDRIIACAGAEDVAAMKEEILVRREQDIDMFRRAIDDATAKLEADAAAVQRVLDRFSIARGAMHEAGLDEAIRDGAWLELDRYLDADDIAAAERQGVIQISSIAASPADVWKLTSKGLQMLKGPTT